MSTAPNNTGLKGQWGVGDPNNPNAQNNPNTQDTGSDKQAQDFQAAFQALQGEINGHLQYTSANAEAAKHGAFASRRDTLYGAFQAALGKIDRKDPSKAQGDIDKVLGDARALSGEVATFRQEAEQAKNDWESRQGKQDEAVRQIEELEAWEDPQAAALRGQADTIRTHTNERRFREACTAHDGLLQQLAPVYEEYLKQKEAKSQYEPGLEALQPRLTAVAASAHVKLSAERDAVGTAQNEMEASAKAKNYVQALEQLGGLATKVEAFEQALEELERQKKAYEDAWAALQPKLTQVEQSTFKKLEPKLQEISAAKAPIESAAQSEEYEQALTLTNDLSTKCDDCLAEVTRLEEQRKAYEDAWAALQPRYEQTAQSEFKKLAPMQEELTSIKGQIDASVQAEDFEAALTQVNDLSSKVDTYLAEVEQAKQKRQAYEDAKATVGPKVTEALQGTSAKLAPDRDALTAAQQQVDTAVEAEDFDQALALTNDLGTKADAYLEAEKALEAQRLSYETALSTLQPELDAVAKSTSKSLQPMRDEIARIKGEMESAAAAEDYEKALQHAQDLTSKTATYKQELDKQRQAYEEQRARIETSMQEVSACTFAQLEPKKAPIMSSYQAMVQQGDAEDYEAAATAGRELEVPIADFIAEAKKLRESIKAQINAQLPQIEADMKEIAEDQSPQMGQIKSLYASVKSAAGSQDDAALEKGAKDLVELGQLVDQVKNDPCGKARRSKKYKQALEDQDIANKEEIAKGIAWRNAKEMYAAKVGKAIGTLDPVAAAQAQRDVDEATANLDVALAKSTKAYNARIDVLKEFGCTSTAK